MSGDDRRQSPLRSEVEHVIQNIVQTQTRRVVPECSLQGSIVSDATEVRHTGETAQRTQDYLAMQYQNRLALNEQQQAMKRGMEQ